MSENPLAKNFYIYVLKLCPQYFETDKMPEEARNVIGVHFRYLQKHMEEGTLLLAGRTVRYPMTENDFGIAILETHTKEEAQSIMDNDPAVKGKVMTATLYDFSLALFRDQ